MQILTHDYAQLALYEPQELYPFGNFGATFTIGVDDVPQGGARGRAAEDAALNTPREFVTKCEIAEDVVPLYHELTEDAKSFAALVVLRGEGTEGGGQDGGGGGVTDDVGGVLCEEMVEQWIRDQMMREGRKPGGQ